MENDKVIQDDVTAMLKPAEPPAEPPPAAEPPKVEPPPAVPATSPEEPPKPPAEPPKDGEPPKPGEPPVVPPVVPPAAPPATPPATPPAEPPKPPADPKDAALAEAMETIKQLRETIGVTARQAVQPVIQPPAPAPVGPDGKPTAPAPVVHAIVEKEEEMDHIMDNAESFNSYMTKVINKAQESVLLAVPQLVAKMADQVVTQKMAVAEFYSSNKDLAAVDKDGRPVYKAFVGMVANDLAAKNPDWNMEKIITELGQEVRSRLRLQGIVVQPPSAPVTGAPPTPPTEPPAFVPGGGARPGGGAPTMTSMEKDILDLIKDA